MIALSQAELRRLTGRTDPAKQIEWLKKEGWPYVLDFDGKPVVGRSAADKRLDNPGMPAAGKPNLAAVR